MMVSSRGIRAFVSSPCYDVMGAFGVLRLTRLKLFSLSHSLKWNKQRFFWLGEGG